MSRAFALSECTVSILLIIVEFNVNEVNLINTEKLQIFFKKKMHSPLVTAFYIR